MTFKPKIFTSKSRPASAPRVERIRTAEIPQPPTFQPTISKRASSIKRSSMGSIGDRLYAAGVETKIKTDLMKIATQQSELRECTFAPRINSGPTSTSTSAAGEEASPARPPLIERMKQFSEEAEQRRREIKSQVDRDRLAEATFSPTITTSKDRSKNANESRDDIFTRLATTTTRGSVAPEQQKPVSAPAQSKPKAPNTFSVSGPQKQIYYFKKKNLNMSIS